MSIHFHQINFSVQNYIGVGSGGMEGSWSEEDYDVYPKAELADVKAQIKSLGGELKEIERTIKINSSRSKR